jgi:Protein of unknown function (DUF3467)
MSSQVQPSLPQPPEVIRTKSSPFTSVYANNVQVEATPWDFKMSFGEVDKVEGNKVFVSETVKVTISPTQMKALVKVLQNTLVQYEAQVGEIKVPQPQS